MMVPTMIFGHLLTSSNFNDEEKKVTGGRNGYGAKLCNVFSTKFIVETGNRKKKKAFKQVNSSFQTLEVRQTAWKRFKFSTFMMWFLNSRLGKITCQRLIHIKSLIGTEMTLQRSLSNQIWRSLTWRIWTMISWHCSNVVRMILLAPQLESRFFSMENDYRLGLFLFSSSLNNLINRLHTFEFFNWRIWFWTWFLFNLFSWKISRTMSTYSWRILRMKLTSRSNQFGRKWMSVGKLQFVPRMTIFNKSPLSIALLPPK